MKLVRGGIFDYKEHKEMVPWPEQKEMGLNTEKSSNALIEQ